MKAEDPMGEPDMSVEEPKMLQPDTLVSLQRDKVSSSLDFGI
jgi:hypothetical protein